MKILSTADWHINFHKKKIPYEWQVNRFKLLFRKILELQNQVDIIVIAGDIFDREPRIDELALFFTFCRFVTKPTIITSGNHEASTKGATFLSHLQGAVENFNIHVIVESKLITLEKQKFYIFPYNDVQLGKHPPIDKEAILITHIRGEVPPHIHPEYDFEILRPWKLVLLGDLHFRHKYKDFNIYYPGSPLNTTFDRNEFRQYGVNIFTINNLDDYSIDFIDLKLPKLIRRNIEAGEELVSDEYNHIIYEVTGDLESLSKVDNHELLDKKIAQKPTDSSTLDLTNLTVAEELLKYLEFTKIADADRIIAQFNKIGLVL